MSARYISTLGPRYALPLIFPSVEAARAHATKADKLIGDLTGMDTMRIEVLTASGWLTAPCATCDMTDNSSFCGCDCHEGRGW